MLEVETMINAKLTRLKKEKSSSIFLVDILGIQGAANFDKGVDIEIKACEEIKKIIAEEKARNHNLLVAVPLRLERDLAIYIDLVEFLNPSWENTGVKLKVDIYRQAIGCFDPS